MPPLRRRWLLLLSMPDPRLKRSRVVCSKATRSHRVARRSACIPMREENHRSSEDIEILSTAGHKYASYQCEVRGPTKATKPASNFWPAVLSTSGHKFEASSPKYNWANIHFRLSALLCRHVSSQARCELVFQLFNRVGPLERLGSLVRASNKVMNGLLKLIQAAEMVRLQEFALKQTEPDLQLVEPRGVGRQPRELHRQFSLRHRRQFLDPAWELLGRMGRSIIQDQRHGLHPTTACLCKNDRLSQKSERRLRVCVDDTGHRPAHRPHGSAAIKCNAPRR